MNENVYKKYKIIDELFFVNLSWGKEFIYYLEVFGNVYWKLNSDKSGVLIYE